MPSRFCNWEPLLFCKECNATEANEASQTPEAKWSGAVAKPLWTCSRCLQLQNSGHRQFVTAVCSSVFELSEQKSKANRVRKPLQELHKALISTRHPTMSRQSVLQRRLWQSDAVPVDLCFRASWKGRSEEVLTREISCRDHSNETSQWQKHRKKSIQICEPRGKLAISPKLEPFAFLGPSVRCSHLRGFASSKRPKASAKRQSSLRLLCSLVKEATQRTTVAK